MTAIKMTKAQRKREQDLRTACIMANITGTTIPNAFLLIDTFRRYERKLQRLAELECNGYPMSVFECRDGQSYWIKVEDAKLRAKCEKQEAKTLERVKDLAVRSNLSAEFQGDPRGLMFRLTYKGREIPFFVLG